MNNKKDIGFPWNLDDLEALNNCIEEKWSTLTDDSVRQRTECKLCTLDNERGGEADCKYCIIQLDTKEPLCDGTPYQDWNRALPGEESEEAANRMLNYLEDLRDRMEKSRDCMESSIGSL